MSDQQIDPSTGLSNRGRSSRFAQWVAFFVFSTITLGASVEVRNENKENPSAAAKYAVTCAAITFITTLLVVVMHLIPVASSFIVGTKVEGTICIIMVAFWVAIVSIVTNASNGLGVQQYQSQQMVDSSGVTAPPNEVLNGNLYYFSWAGFVTSILLLVNYLREAFGVDVVGEVRNRSARLTLWAGLLASAMVVMGSAARVWIQECSPDLTAGAVYCRRTKFALSDGVVTVLLALAVVGTKLLTTTAPFIFEFAFASFLAILNGFEVAYVTSTKGPGQAIGNLYYFSWIAFLCSAFSAADCFNQFISGDAGGTGRTASSDDKNYDDPHGEIAMGHVRNQV